MQAMFHLNGGETYFTSLIPSKAISKHRPFDPFAAGGRRQPGIYARLEMMSEELKHKTGRLICVYQTSLVFGFALNPRKLERLILQHI